MSSRWDNEKQYKIQLMNGKNEYKKIKEEEEEDKTKLWTGNENSKAVLQTKTRATHKQWMKKKFCRSTMKKQLNCGKQKKRSEFSFIKKTKKKCLDEANDFSFIWLRTIN